MEYIREGFTLPVPFNLIPRPTVIYQLIINLSKRFKQNSRHDKTSINGIMEEQPSIYEMKSQVSICNGFANKEKNSQVRNLFKIFFSF